MRKRGGRFDMYVYAARALAAVRPWAGLGQRKNNYVGLSKNM